MRQSFFGLNIALSGLYTAQKNLNTVSHNISNANTPGYSRQQNVQSASSPLSVLDGTGMVGTGSEVKSVNRIRDEYLDFKYWSESTAAGEWSKKAELLEELEGTFNEPSDSGFVTIMNDFFNAYQELSKDPSSAAVRALVREKGVTLSKYFNSTATHFEKMQEDINDQVRITVDEINSLASQIQQLNKQIYNFEVQGQTANDLRDARTLLVDKLSKLVNIQANEVSYGVLPSGEPDIHFVITISGRPLVDHFSVGKLTVVQRPEKLNDEDIINLYEVKWEDGNQLKVTGGELRGLLDVRDGKDGALSVDGKSETPRYKGIPYYQSKLNEFVQIFALAFNEGLSRDETGAWVNGDGHADGWGYDSDLKDGADPSTNIRFFTILDGDRPISSAKLMEGLVLSDPPTDAENALIIARYKSMITAKNFTVSSDVMDNTDTIATSDTKGENGNIELLNKIMNIRTNDSLFKEGAPEDFMKSLVAGLGIDAQQANRLSASQTTIAEQVDYRRMSVSGVELNEEMADMVRFQQAYNAAAKMITTMSEIYDTLINRLGVG